MAFKTGTNKGGLSVYDANVLMNLLNEVGAMPTKNSQMTYSKASRVRREMFKEHLLVANNTVHLSS